MLRSGEERYGVYTRFEETKFNVILEPNQRLVFILPESVLLPTVSASILSLESPREKEVKYVGVN